MTTYTYDPVGRLTAVAAPEGSLGYTYDAVGNRTSMTMSGARQLAYRYDAAGQETGITDWLGQSFGFTYNTDGRIASVSRPSGISTGYGYDAAGRLVSVNHDAASGPVAHYAYALDQNGNLVAATSATGTERYTLDALVSGDSRDDHLRAIRRDRDETSVLAGAEGLGTAAAAVPR